MIFYFGVNTPLHSRSDVNHLWDFDSHFGFKTKAFQRVKVLKKKKLSNYMVSVQYIGVWKCWENMFKKSTGSSFQKTSISWCSIPPNLHPQPPQPPWPPGHLWPPTGFTKGDIIAHRRLSKDPQLETLRGLPAGLVWLLVVHGRNLQLEQTCWKIEAGRNGEKCGSIEPKCGSWRTVNIIQSSQSCGKYGGYIAIYSPNFWDSVDPKMNRSHSRLCRKVGTETPSIHGIHHPSAQCSR